MGLETHEARAAQPASLVLSPRGGGGGGGGNAPDDGAAWKLKLPMLTARPGNVGIQIDSFRTMKMFNRPRCGKFTAQFQGISFENNSMENYSRVMERTQVRTRIVSERLQKLKDHEAKLIADEQCRRQRRQERERAEQRHQWLVRQTTKKAEQLDREERAALILQRVTRGAAARQRAEKLREERDAHKAARCLQSSMKSFVRKKDLARRRQEREKERHLRAATVIQRQARRRLSQDRRLETLPAAGVKNEERSVVPPEADAVKVESAKVENDSSKSPSSSVDAGTHTVESTTDLSHELSLELLFSDAGPAEGNDSLPKATTTKPPDTMRLRRPVTIKRVGGGFCHSTFQSPRLRTSKPPDLPDAIVARPQPPQHHQPRVPRGRVTVQRQPAGAPATDRANRNATNSSSQQDGFTGLDEENGLLDLVEQLDSVAPARSAATVTGEPISTIDPLEVSHDTGISSGT